MSRESVSVTEAGKLLDVSRWTIWRLVKDGKLDAFVVRHSKRILLSELRRYIKDNSYKHGAARSTE